MGKYGASPLPYAAGYKELSCRQQEKMTAKPRKMGFLDVA